MSSNNSPDSPLDWRKLPEFLKEWLGAIVPLAGAVGALFTILGFQPHGKAEVVSYAVVLVLLGVGGYAVYRAKRKREAALRQAELRASFETRRVKRTTFRGLYPYQEGDVLPGLHRKREAQTIFTNITDPAFSFGVVYGESGCGKTSLLRSTLQTLLKDSQSHTGLHVLYVGGLADLTSEEIARAHDLTLAERLEFQLLRLKAMVREAAGDSATILILDQFEEFLVQYKSCVTRVGETLNQLIHATPPARVLCAVRQDYLADMRLLAPHLPEPLSVKTLFELANFTTEEAAAVISECADIDEVALDSELAKTIAVDLGEGGDVRPPELQIVCAALISNPSIAEYRLRGGARGILAHHIQNSIAVCESSALGGQILRALCSFPSNTKREPQTLNDIFPSLNPPVNLKPEEVTRIVKIILNQFEEARLVRIESAEGGETYALVHDYLVKSVAYATADDKTRVEKANQLLQYYIAEHSDDAKTRIPFRRYRFIKKYADKALLKDEHARRLLRATRNTWVISGTALLLMVLIVIAAVLTVVTTHRTWEGHLANRMLPETGSAIVDGDIYPLAGGSRVLTYVQDIEWVYAKLWDTKTAELLLEVKADGFRLDQPNQMLLVLDRTAGSVYVVDLRTQKKYQLPISAAAVAATQNLDQLVSLSEVRGLLILSAKEDWPPPPPPPPPFRPGSKPTRPPSPPPPPAVIPAPSNTGIKLWSALDQQNRSVVPLASWSTTPGPFLNKSTTRLLAMTYSSEGTEWKIWNTDNGEPIASFANSDEQLIDFAVDEINNKLVVAKALHSDYSKVKIEVRNLDNGQAVSPEITMDQDNANWTRVAFSAQGDFVIVSSGNDSDGFIPRTVLHSSNLLPSEHIIGRELNWAETVSDAENPPAYIYWSSESGTQVWDLSAKPPSLLPGLTLHPFKRDDRSHREELVIIPDRQRAFVVRQNWSKELYDLASGNKIAELEHHGGYWNIHYTYDGSAVSIQATDGMNHFFSLANGKKLAQLQNSASSTAFYDDACGRISVWYSEGSIYTYRESYMIMGRWPWPVKQCRDQKN